MKLLRKLIRIELLLIYMVILAGSIVRMTGSGMGCPDWPKCFGHLIPPTEASTLKWRSNTPFKEGQMIIYRDSLRVARRDFITASHINLQNWEPYTKHSYAKFNPTHTWIEYINRLIGALSGIPMLLIFFLSLYLSYRTRRWILSLLAAAALFMLGFEAWLGKLVVDGNLIPGSITIHMLGSVVIIALLILLLHSSRKTRKRFIQPISPLFRNLVWIAVGLTILQIALGTQVREQIDVLQKEGVARLQWIAELNEQFYLHRSFSIAIFLINAWIFWLNRKLLLKFRMMNMVMLLLLLSISAGVILNYMGMPAFAQPLHLLLALLLFGAQFYVLGRIYRR